MSPEAGGKDGAVNSTVTPFSIDGFARVHALNDMPPELPDLAPDKPRGIA